jgi:hypothetical protein
MHEKFVAATRDVGIATPGGSEPTIDPHSMNPKVVGQEHIDQFRAYLDSVSILQTKPYSPMWMPASMMQSSSPGATVRSKTLIKDPDMGWVLVEVEHEQKIIAPVCGRSARRQRRERQMAVRRPEADRL